MAFCIECGAKLPENAKFCLNCGTRISEAPAENVIPGNKEAERSCGITGIDYNQSFQQEETMEDEPIDESPYKPPEQEPTPIRKMGPLLGILLFAGSLAGLFLNSWVSLIVGAVISVMSIICLVKGTRLKGFPIAALVIRYR